MIADGFKPTILVTAGITPTTMQNEGCDNTTVNTANTYYQQNQDQLQNIPEPQLGAILQYGQDAAPNGYSWVTDMDGNHVLRVDQPGAAIPSGYMASTATIENSETGEYETIDIISWAGAQPENQTPSQPQGPIHFVHGQHNAPAGFAWIEINTQYVLRQTDPNAQAPEGYEFNTEWIPGEGEYAEMQQIRVLNWLGEGEPNVAPVQFVHGDHAAPQGFAWVNDTDNGYLLRRINDEAVIPNGYEIEENYNFEDADEEFAEIEDIDILRWNP